MCGDDKKNYERNKGKKEGKGANGSKNQPILQ